MFEKHCFKVYNLFLGMLLHWFSDCPNRLERDGEAGKGSP